MDYLIKDCTNLNHNILQHPAMRFGVYRRPQIEAIIRTLVSDRDVAPLVVGSDVIDYEDLMQAIAAKANVGDVPKALQEAMVYEIDMRQQSVLKLNRVLLSFVSTQHDHDVLFVNHLFAGDSPAPKTALLTLERLISRGFRIVVATDNDDFMEHIMPNKSLLRHLNVITVPKPTPIQLFAYAMQNKPAFREYYHDINASADLVKQLVQTCLKYFGRNMDVVLDVMDEMFSTAMINRQKECTSLDLKIAVHRKGQVYHELNDD